MFISTFLRYRQSECDILTNIKQLMENEDLKFVFWGTPEIASQTLEILKKSDYLPLLIITSPDKPAGRGLHLTSTPVSIWADKNKITCLKPEKIDQEFLKNIETEFSLKSINLSIVVAYGKILPQKAIDLPNLGTINIHYSLLPKYRGASPLESALLNNDKITGVTIQQMVFKLDSGPILIKKEIPIRLEETKGELREKLIKLGAETLVKILPKLQKSKIISEEQNEKEATYCKKIKKEDGLLDLKNDDIKNYSKYRAFTDWPETYFLVDKNNKKIRIKIKKAKYENNSFIIERVIPEGKKEIDYNDFNRNN